MSSRKCPGGAADSRPAQKRSRLLPSSAGGTLQTEPIELEQSGAAASEPAADEVIDLAGESSEPEVTISSDDESAVDREQSQQQPHLVRASGNSAEPLARDDVEEPRDIDDDWLRFDFNRPYGSDEDSEDREQNQQQPHVSSAAENSADLLARDDEEEPRDVDGPWLAGPASTPSREDEDSEDSEPPHFFIIVENSAELPARDAEEEPRDNQGWPDRVYVALFRMHYYSEQQWRYLQQQPRFVRAEDNSAVLVMRNNEEEQRDDDNALPVGPASPPVSEDEDSELLQVHEQERRNVTLNSQEQVDGSGTERGANDAPVAGPAPAGQGAAEERTACPDAQPGVVIRCPICMDHYSEIMQNGRQLTSTLCGHVFCSRCLPIALENTHMCPTCRMILNPELHHPIYL